MNRTQYNEARKLVRENGAAAYKRLSRPARAVFLDLNEQSPDYYDEIMFLMNDSFFKSLGGSDTLSQRVKTRVFLSARYKILGRI